MGADALHSRAASLLARRVGDTGFRFPSTGDTGVSPADASLAVGRSALVETTNSEISIWTKAGQLVSAQGFGSFFPGSRFCVDPRPIYWSWDDRFAVVCSDIQSNPKVIRLAVSASNDPNGSWYRYEIGAVNDVINGYDQPAVEATSDKLVIVAFYCPPPDPGDGTCSGDQFFIMQLKDVVDGRPSPRVVHRTISGFALNKPAVQITPTPNAYFVNDFARKKGSDGQPKDINKVQLTVVSGQLLGKGRSKLSVTVRDLGTNTWQKPQMTVPLPGGSAGSMIDPPDGRVHNAVYELESSDRRPIIEFGASASCGGRDCNGVGQIRLDPKPRVSSQITLGQPGFDDTFGSVGLDAFGDYFVSYSQSSASQAPQARLLSSNFNQVIFDAAMEAIACISSGPCGERWGDYLGVAQDPVDRSHVWAAGEYQSQTGKWGTVITEATVNGTL